MTVVIGVIPGDGYSHEHAGRRRYPAGCSGVRKARRRLSRTPRPGSAHNRRAVRRGVTAAEVFAHRVGDLAADELLELHAETFRDEAPAVRRLLVRLARTRTDDAGAGAAVRALEPLLERLEAERNPFAYVVRSLCCLLLGRVKAPRPEQSS